MSRNLWYRWVLAGVIAFSVLGVALIFYEFVRPHQFGEHVTRKDSPIWFLPPDATDICYYLPTGFAPIEVFEFSVSEEGFLAWARKHNWDVVEIGTEPCRIDRYVSFSDGHYRPETKAVIKDGLQYAFRENDRSVSACFDRSSQRAYFRRSSR